VAGLSQAVERPLQLTVLEIGLGQHQHPCHGLLLSSRSPRAYPVVGSARRLRR
jgi:hypothetical protein